MVAVVRVPMTFPPEQRPIHVINSAHLSKKTEDTARPLIAQSVRGVARLHQNDRILIHTVSYPLAKYIVANMGKDLSSRVVTYTQASEREAAITKYRKNPRSILIASSLDRGVDFYGDDCRVVVVCKLPFPFLGDKQISKRLHSPNGQHWYNIKTVRTLEQMTGRGMRRVDDHCTSYILDSQFSSKWRDLEPLFHDWWKESLDWTTGRRPVINTLGERK